MPLEVITEKAWIPIDDEYGHITAIYYGTIKEVYDRLMTFRELWPDDTDCTLKPYQENDPSVRIMFHSWAGPKDKCVRSKIFHIETLEYEEGDSRREILMKEILKKHINLKRLSEVINAS